MVVNCTLAYILVGLTLQKLNGQVPVGYHAFAFAWTWYRDPHQVPLSFPSSYPAERTAVVP